ncbi:hypothetical protein [Roseovarius albus]|uniref:hypothetical protein n=1 Tax=Roseovarius albus TaxID=1247867 RepID=UPI00117A16DC|nr:hypothetical protein [Roseovarius albus]
MLSNDAVSHQAIFTVPQEVAQTLQLGDAVHFKFSDKVDAPKKSAGTISALKPSARTMPSGSTQIVVVDVSQDMLSALGVQPDEMMAVGAVTHASLVVSLEPQSLKDTLLNAETGLNIWSESKHWIETLWTKPENTQNLHL